MSLKKICDVGFTKENDNSLKQKSICRKMKNMWPSLKKKPDLGITNESASSAEKKAK